MDLIAYGYCIYDELCSCNNDHGIIMEFSMITWRKSLNIHNDIIIKILSYYVIHDDEISKGISSFMSMITII